MILFKSQKDWAEWLEKNHDTSSGIWVSIAKTKSGITSVSYAEAVETALCYGWIDGQRKSLDASSFLQKFTPRGEKSIWSKINREKAEALIRSRKVKPAGMKAIDRAKQNGRWEAAYDSPGRATVPSDLQAKLNQNPKAKAFFETLNSQNRYAILFRIQTAKKPETRAKRIQQFIRMLVKHERLYP
jgi:uncharacterized protein YdeI (YjbR/CyaY-like superfamily)